jgi:hypothetical protein
MCIASCGSSKYGVRLEMQLFQDGQPKALKFSQPTVSEGLFIDVGFEHCVELSVGRPTYIMSTYALRTTSDLRNTVNTASFSGLEDALGIKATSLHMTDRLWTALCSPNYEAAEAVELCVVGRCTEQILGVTAVPVSGEQKPPAAKLGEAPMISNILTGKFVDVQSSL